MDLLFDGSLSIRERDDFRVAVIAYYVNHLTTEEIAQIRHRCESNEWHQNCQVLWSGLDQQQVQRWANSHGLQTLKAILGPLMDQWHETKHKKQLSTCMKGASAIFAWYISHGDTVTVLSPPPPERFHPSKQTNFQTIEEPILKGIIRGISVPRIEIVHPMVKGAEDFHYQIWPADETHTWIEKFGKEAIPKPHWREVKANFLEKMSQKLPIYGLKPKDLELSAGGTSRSEKNSSSVKGVSVGVRQKNGKKEVEKRKKGVVQTVKSQNVKKKGKHKKKRHIVKTKTEVKNNKKRSRTKMKVKEKVRRSIKKKSTRKKKNKRTVK